MNMQSEMETMREIHAAAEAGAAPRTRRTGPGSRYVAVPAEAIEKKLADMGFVRGSFGGEVTFSLVHKRCKHITITVYTSLPVRGSEVRGVGEDAIRVTAVYKKPWRGRDFVRVVHRATRVHRTGSVEGVLQRLYERAREAYAACNESLKVSETTCFECCSPKGGR